ncbi:MAG: hypothetical protein ABW360_07540 [Phenylobacterium sp.]
MPVLAIYRSDNTSSADYDRYRSALPLDQAPPGALLHSYARDGDGYCVVEVWKDAESARRFNDEVVAPTAARLGLPHAKPQILEIADLVAVDGLDKACVTLSETGC